MTTVYPLCVFLDSRKHGRLPIDHPFHQFVKENLEHVIESPLILHYMAKNTFQNEPCNNGAEDSERRVQEIIQYLETNHPTVSASDSPAMCRSRYLQVEARAYSGCGKDRQSRKIARKHIYINKKFVDIWMTAYFEVKVNTNQSLGHYLVHSFLFKLCLLRGLILAVKTAFMSPSGDVSGMKVTQMGGPHDASGSFSVPGSPCSFEHFLWEWDALILLCTSRFKVKVEPILLSIVFKKGLCHAQPIDNINMEYAAGERQALLRFNWTAFPPVHPFFLVKDKYYTRIWNSPPKEDPRPYRVEMVQWTDKSSICCVV